MTHSGFLHKTIKFLLGSNMTLRYTHVEALGHTSVSNWIPKETHWTIWGPSDSCKGAEGLYGVPMTNHRIHIRQQQDSIGNPLAENYKITVGKQWGSIGFPIEAIGFTSKVAGSQMKPIEFQCEWHNVVAPKQDSTDSYDRPLDLHQKSTRFFW